MARFFGAFSDEEDVFENYSVPVEDRANYAILVAAYDLPGYEGYAFVFYRDLRDGKFYEVYGSHCSCYGLEDQWGPEKSNVFELVDRPVIVGYDFSAAEQEEIRQAIRDAAGI